MPYDFDYQTNYWDYTIVKRGMISLKILILKRFIGDHWFIEIKPFMSFGFWKMSLDFNFLTLESSFENMVGSGNYVFGLLISKVKLNSHCKS